MNPQQLPQTDRQSPSTAERNDDVRWAQTDATVESQHGGKWVVPYRRQIVASGTDPQAVLEEAASATGRNADELVVCAVPGTESWLTDA